MIYRRRAGPVRRRNPGKELQRLLQYGAVRRQGDRLSERPPHALVNRAILPIPGFQRGSQRQLRAPTSGAGAVLGIATYMATCFGILIENAEIMENCP